MYDWEAVIEHGFGMTRATKMHLVKSKKILSPRELALVQKRLPSFYPLITLLNGIIAPLAPSQKCGTTNQ
jgi:hypothetical protein